MKKLLMMMLLAAGLPTIVSVNAQEANDDCLNFYSNDENAIYANPVVCIATSMAAYQASDYHSFKASTYGILGTGGGEGQDKFVNAFTHKDINGNDATMSDKIMYVNFGLSKGYFVQYKSKGNIQANRAYFSAHADLTELFEEGKSIVNNSMMAIYREGSDKTGTTGVVTIDTDRTAVPRDNTYYTIDGRRINGKPTAKGIYIINGRKEVVR